MKILHILNEFDNAGNGIVNVCCDLACEQSKEGHDVLVVSSGGAYVNLLEKFGGRHIFLDQSRRKSNFPKMILSYFKIIRNFGPEIVHAHMITGACLGIIGKLTTKYRLISTVHNVYQKGVGIMNFSDKIVCLSPKIKDFFLEKKVNEKKLVVIENGVLGSARRIPINKVEKKTLKHPNIITLGAVCERKGSDVLFEAFSKISSSIPLHLYYIGNVDWPEFKNTISKSKYSDNVHFLGLETQPLKYLLDADIFVLASRRETFPLSILEAKEAGLPIIASDTDGNPDALDQGKSGLLFKTNDVNDLITQILSLLKNNDHLEYFKLQSKLTSSRFTVKEMSQKYVELYQSLLK